jgi:hypothetical protein
MDRYTSTLACWLSVNQTGVIQIGEIEKIGVHSKMINDTKKTKTKKKQTNNHDRK